MITESLTLIWNMPLPLVCRTSCCFRSFRFPHIDTVTVYPQKVTLYQTGDLVEGASFNNFLDGIDGSYCTSGGGDNPT